MGCAIAIDFLTTMIRLFFRISGSGPLHVLRPTCMYEWYCITLIVYHAVIRFIIYSFIPTEFYQRMSFTIHTRMPSNIFWIHFFKDFTHVQNFNVKILNISYVSLQAYTQTRSSMKGPVIRHIFHADWIQHRVFKLKSFLAVFMILCG